MMQRVGGGGQNLEKCEYLNTPYTIWDRRRLSLSFGRWSFNQSLCLSVEFFKSKHKESSRTILILLLVVYLHINTFYQEPFVCFLLTHISSQEVQSCSDDDCIWTISLPDLSNYSLSCPSSNLERSIVSAADNILLDWSYFYWQCF